MGALQSWPSFARGLGYFLAFLRGCSPQARRYRPRLFKIPCQPIRPDVPIALIERVTAAAFGQRRKMLRSSLAALSVDTQALLRDADIDPAARAEQLSVEEFARLAWHFGVYQAARKT